MLYYTQLLLPKAVDSFVVFLEATISTTEQEEHVCMCWSLILKSHHRTATAFVQELGWEACVMSLACLEIIRSPREVKT